MAAVLYTIEKINMIGKPAMMLPCPAVRLALGAHYLLEMKKAIMREAIVKTLFVSIVLLALVPYAFAKKTIAQNPELQQVLGSVHSPNSRVKSITVLKENGGRVSWSPIGNFILMDQKNDDGYYDIYKIRPDGSEEQCLTCDKGEVLGKGHIGQPEWHPSGKYMVFQVQKLKKQGNWGRDLAATPGFGRHSDLWLMELSTTRCYLLRQTPDTEASGVLHPHFSDDGTKLTWAEMYGAPNMFKGYGKWTIQLADFAFEGARPVLSNIKSYEPGKPGWYENHGLSPDGRKLLFTSSFAFKKPFHSNVYSYDIAEKRLELLAEGKWNEHALYSPSGKKILYMSSAHNKGGTDYWSMNLDGSGKISITDWNNPELTTWKNKMIVAADASFSPDGKYLVAYLQVNLLSQDGLTVLIELEENWEEPGHSVRLQ